MDDLEQKTPGAAGHGDTANRRTPEELLRFRLRIAHGFYDRAQVADRVARRLLAGGGPDPPPGTPAWDR